MANETEIQIGPLFPVTLIDLSTYIGTSPVFIPPVSIPPQVISAYRALSPKHTSSLSVSSKAKASPQKEVRKHQSGDTRSYQVRSSSQHSSPTRSRSHDKTKPNRSPSSSHTPKSHSFIFLYQEHHYNPISYFIFGFYLSKYSIPPMANSPPSKQPQILQWNCRGLRMNNEDPYLIKTHFPKVLYLQETHIIGSTIHVPCFKMYHAPAESLVVYNPVTYTILNITCPFSVLAIKGTLHHPFTIASIYIPPEFFTYYVTT